MRYAILSDVHANAAALKAVLTDAADMRAERIVCLGDVLGYGPEPVEALETVYRRAHVCLAGNHDDAVCGRRGLDDFTEFAAAAVLRHRAMLSQKAIDWLRRLPHSCEFPSADGSPAEGAFACAHGDFYDPKRFEYVLEPADAVPSWRERPEQLLFVGHTHKPGVFVLDGSGAPYMLEPDGFTLKPGSRYLVNVGSVGYPRSGACRSFYCIYDNRDRKVSFRSLPFDLDGYRAKMDGQGLDEAPWMAARARERKPVEIRVTEKFGKSEKKRRLAEPVAVPPPPRPAGARFARPFAFGAVLLALAGVWCAVRLARALREERDALAAVHAVEVASVAPAAGTDGGFEAAQPLSGGWMASFEFPGLQRVQVDRNAKTKEAVFRLACETNGTVRFSKTLSLFSRPPKVYYTIRMLTAARPGTAVPFKFTARLTFMDSAGRPVGEDIQTKSRSITGHAVPVPDGAESAQLRIDCVCRGTYDLAIPVFKAEPVPSRARKGATGN